MILENHILLIYNNQNDMGCDNMSVGANIKKRRMELRLSQQELADAMGYRTRSTIAKIESGENDVSQKKLQRFAAVLNTTIAFLVEETQSEDAPTPVSIMSGHKRNKNIVVILAGGNTGHNRQNIPGQFVNVHGKPVLVWCMDAYQNHPAIDDIYVVCLKGWERIVKAYAVQYGITKLKGLCPAGSSGMASLKNALDYVFSHYAPEDLVFVQEATRPQVNTETISQLLQATETMDSATFGHRMQDYVQFAISESAAKYVDRNSLIAVQSPEVHRLFLLKEVFTKVRQQSHPLTESCCTMLFNKLGYPVNFIESSINNIKIVRDEDIAAFGTVVSGRV